MLSRHSWRTAWSFVRRKTIVNSLKYKEHYAWYGLSWLSFNDTWRNVWIVYEPYEGRWLRTYYGFVVERSSCCTISVQVTTETTTEWKPLSFFWEFCSPFYVSVGCFNKTTPKSTGSVHGFLYLTSYQTRLITVHDFQLPIMAKYIQNFSWIMVLKLWGLIRLPRTAGYYV